MHPTGSTDELSHSSFRSPLGGASLGWPQATLAERAGVSLPTIKRLEPGDGLLSANHQTVVALQRALEDAGVVPTNGKEPWVKLKPR